MTLRKADLRAQVLAARRLMAGASRAAAGDSLATVILGLPEMRSVETVAAYISIGTEPATARLLNTLSERGVRLLAPALMPDLDLDWVDYDVGSGREPRKLGPDAVKVADVVIAPALAVDVRGTRLGRGGGSYDRALARVSETTPVIVPLYDGEVLPDVPAEDHDRRVSVALTPSRVWRFT